jgi:hypothetical protein
MKNWYGLLLVLTLFSAAPASEACAQVYDWGAGIMLGEPTGFSGKTWWSDDVAFDAGLAWSFEGENEVSLHTDVLFHNWTLLRDTQRDVTEGTELPLYYGFGVRLKVGDTTRFGARFPVGIDLIFGEYPFDLFIEVAPIMDIVPDTSVRGQAAVGFRYWF